MRNQVSQLAVRGKRPQLMMRRSSFRRILDTAPAGALFEKIVALAKCFQVIGFSQRFKATYLYWEC